MEAACWAPGRSGEFKGLGMVVTGHEGKAFAGHLDVLDPNGAHNPLLHTQLLLNLSCCQW